MLNSLTRDFWTDDRIELLQKLWADGLSCSQIGVEMGNSRNAIIGKASRLGLTRGRPAKPKILLTMPREEKAKRQRRLKLHRRPIFGGPIVNYTEDKPLPQEVIVAQDFLGVDLLDLADGQCRYPHGDSPFTFCGQPVKSGSSYCAAHHIACWQKNSARGS